MPSRPLSPHRPLLKVVVGVITTGILLTSQGTALAVANPHTPEGVCGSGYRVIESHPLVGSAGTGGRVYLLYNSGNGYNCSVTIKSVAVGTASQVTADLQVFTGNSVKGYRDRGNYKYYAGPVKAYAAGKCVAIYGDVDSGANTFVNQGPKGHCG
ncbi:hypothetical protein [Streptosporangium subroseum]|uniref:hypothetical protein n=1 Tax=Streptosporangium subroseum TaxID=106412 RepID=UPI0030847314|nr:hypothetical protein OHB15_39090 [Streptosporangium subroseum]